MRDWISFLLNATQRQETAIVITVASTRGSVPREAGTKMVVTATEVNGTIGGGHLEFRAIDIARDIIAADGARAMHRFPLGATLGQCCGGVVNLLFEPVPAEAGWVETVASLHGEGKACVIITPTSGDAPAGKLIFDVTNAECVVAAGTLGARELDDEARTIVQTMLGGVHSTALKQLSASVLNPEQSYFFDCLCAADFHIVLFGAGHVGRALVKVMSELDCAVTWVDSRDDAFPIAIPANVETICTDLPEAVVAEAPPGSYFLVMTHSHALDQALSECILRRRDFAYFGLIGSLPKRRQFEQRLQARGISAAQLAGMQCPIGAAGIDGKEPATIAISVAAEILQVRNKIQAAEHHADTSRLANAS
jgi:xanthine dehydrogenase accessory factor